MSFRVGPKGEPWYVASTDGWACVVAERMANRYRGVPMQVRRVSDGALLGCWFREEPDIESAIKERIEADHWTWRFAPEMQDIYGDAS